MTTNTCPRCKRTFRVLADESGDHACPFCGWETGCDEDYEEVCFCGELMKDHTGLHNHTAVAMPEDVGMRCVGKWEIVDESKEQKDEPPQLAPPRV